jgi:hypothetical protein
MNEQKTNSPHVPISWGELIDKITILEIKQEKITTASANLNVSRELQLLRGIVIKNKALTSAIDSLKNNLSVINQKLWKIEDDIREKESKKQFDQTFIELARSVYFCNDERARLKKEINLVLGSELIEEKSYKDTTSRSLLAK